jgi:S-adenosylmethionine uptake transporter
MPMLNPNLRGALLGLGAFGLYALYDMTIKLLGGDYSPAQILFFAMLFAVPALLIQILMSRDGGGLRPVMPGWTLARSAVALFNGVLGAYGFAVLPLAECYAIFFTMPLMIALLAVPLLREPLDLPRVLAVLAGFVGVLVVLRPGQSTLLPAHAAVFGAAALGAVSYIIVRKTSGIEKPGVVLIYPMITQLVATGIALPFFWVPVTGPFLGFTALMGVELFVGGFLVVWAYRHAPAIVVAPMQYSQIIWAAVLGALFFDEVMDGRTIVGIGIIVGAGLVLLRQSGVRSDNT